MAQLKGVGTDDKKKVAIAASLGLVVLVLAFKTIFGGTPTPPPPAVPVRPAALASAPAPARSAPAAGMSPTTSSSNLDPALHPELMAENENYLYAGSGRNIFAQNSAAPTAAIAIEKVKAPVRPSMVMAAAVNTGPPPPPAIDLRFFGYSARRNGTRKAFFLHGDDVFVASEGDVVSHRYRVVRIGPFSVDVEDLPYHDTQSLPLVQN
ncbi:hypothetical protein [Acidipila sp. EB88]|uniref:hypothetical protein n=1 Tax=Acidipila sp. EB88 TaxID=2305226 RepID=UPI000F5E2241|nr:hypothetical protein [Acidipila sp. EB88]RRA48974.1 hypothetical protein D1Y84_12515 [Acidipila sp. EB88]